MLKWYLQEANEFSSLSHEYMQNGEFSLYDNDFQMRRLGDGRLREETNLVIRLIRFV